MKLISLDNLRDYKKKYDAEALIGFSNIFPDPYLQNPITGTPANNDWVDRAGTNAVLSNGVQSIVFTSVQSSIGIQPSYQKKIAVGGKQKLFFKFKIESTATITECKIYINEYNSGGTAIVNAQDITGSIASNFDNIQGFVETNENCASINFFVSVAASLVVGSVTSISLPLIINATSFADGNSVTKDYISNILSKKTANSWFAYFLKFDKIGNVYEKGLEQEQEIESIQNLKANKITITNIFYDQKLQNSRNLTVRYNGGTSVSASVSGNKAVFSIGGNATWLQLGFTNSKLQNNVGNRLFFKFKFETTGTITSIQAYIGNDIFGPKITSNFDNYEWEADNVSGQNLWFDIRGTFVSGNTISISLPLIVDLTADLGDEKEPDTETMSGLIKEKTEYDWFEGTIPLYDLKDYMSLMPSVSEIIPDYTAIFNLLDWGIIGDSLYDGGVDYQNGGSNATAINRKYSVPSIMERMMGMCMENYSISGATTYTMNSGTDERAVAMRSSAHQAYILELGTNDVNLLINSTTFPVGDANTDINLSDYTQNANTFVGQYAKIIQRIRTNNPNCFFFLVPLMTRNTGTYAQVNLAIKSVADKFNKCYYVDMLEDFSKWNAYTNNALHLLPQGYVIYSKYLVQQMSKVILKNYSDFNGVSTLVSPKNIFDTGDIMRIVNAYGISLSNNTTLSSDIAKSLCEKHLPLKINGFVFNFSYDDGTNYQYSNVYYDGTNIVSRVWVINKTTWNAVLRTV